MSTELDDILENKRVLKVAGHDVVLDPKNLEFDEANLSKFQEKLAVLYDYYGQRWAEAEAELQFHDAKLDLTYYSMFVAAKESGLSDKAAEAKVKSDKDYNEMKQNMGMAKLKVRLLQQHLRAFDKAHENASNRGHMLRKELDRLYFKSNATSEGDDTPTYEDKLNEVMKHGSEA